MNARWVTAIVAVALVAAVAAVPAAADPIAGATYKGVTANGAMVQFTVSGDGTLVDSYAISVVNGQVPGGGTCQFLAEGQNGVWEGAPIVSNAFGYQLRNQILFQGTFHGAKSASGTFHLFLDATYTQSGALASPPCDSGTVSWTATTTASPSGGQGGGPGGATGSGGTGGGGGHAAIFSTRITFRKASSQLLRGQIKSPHGACRSGRTVTLWMGKHRIASTRSKAEGKFSFARATRIRGRAVRASTPAKNMPAGSCAAGSSTFIKG